jgi:hypothetical protein
MAGAIDKKKLKTKGELEDSPVMHIDARAAILSDIALSREFAHTFLQALCKGHTGGKNEAGATTTMSLGTVCESLAAQRLICYGAGSIKGSAQGIRKFILPSYETVNGALTLTEANTSLFGYVATDLTETNTITLSNTTTANQTIDGNTFSTYVGNYYMIRSRVSGELETTSGNLSAYTTPDSPGGDIVFGNAIAWGSSVSGEQAANTWNYHWAKANVASVAIKNSGGVLELNTLTLADHITQGSNTNYTPLGPGFNNKFYLRKHADSVNTFTITGTTTTDSVVVTAISAADILKIKYNDVISGTGISVPSTIAAVQATDSQLRLSTAATANGTVTLSVDSVPLGHAAHDIFCQVEVSAEGLVANSTWTPVGDDAGTYATGSEDDLCVANTTSFTGLLGFFDPANANVAAAGGNHLSAGASSTYTSDGKEYDGTLYPDIEKNPLKPSNSGTTKTYEVKSGEIIGTQPSGLGDKDIWSGRFVRFDKERANAAGALPEFRYVTDSAERFYYAPQANAAVATMGSVTAIAGHSMPSTTEPRAVLPRTGLASVVTLIRADETLHASTNATSNWTVPVDDVVHANGISGLGQDTATSTSYWYRLSGGIIRKHSFVTSYTNSNSTFETVSNGLGAVVDYPIVSNYIARKLTTDGSVANADVAFVTGVIDELQGTTAGGAKFRDPVMEGASTKHVTSASANDANFDTYICATTGTNAVDTALASVKASLAAFYTAAEMAGRNTRLDGGADNVGTAVNCASFGSSDNVHGKWVTFSANCGTLVTTLDARIAEIDGRIGVPTYAYSSGSASATAGNPPTVRVSAIPTSNATGGVVPYGKSLYNNINLLLGQDIDLLGGIIKDVEGLTDLVGLVKTARNKYEIYSGRDKEY